jgi:hypothetical protein
VLEDFLKLLRQVAAGMVDDAMITRGSQWIEHLKKEFPAAHLIIMSLLYRSPEHVLDALANMNSEIKPFRRNPNAIAYIAALQKRLKGKK